MLITTIRHSVPYSNSVFSFSSPYIKRIKEHYYEVYPDKSDQPIAQIKIADNTVEFSYSEDLELERYILLHDVILSVQSDVKGTVDDSKSFLGYIETGEPAFIVRNWSKWMKYIHQSMKNCQEG